MAGRAQFETLAGLLEHHASLRGGALAIAQLGDDGSVAESRTFEQLHRNASRLGGVLGRRFRHGDRVILAPTAPAGFIEGFFALIYAGLIPVPAPSPRTAAARHRIQSQARDCDAEWVLLAEADMRSVRSRPREEFGLQCASLEALLEESGGGFDAPACPHEVAFLQYTSGSTSNPRGVVVTHRCVLANEAQIASACRHGESTVFGSWLPLFHDMGLIGGVLQPLFLGVPGYHLTPLQFHAQPSRWLKAIGGYGITTTGGPNFAYDACVDRIPEGQRDFDLTSWKVAFNGAEPVSARTLRRFAAAYEPHGFRTTAFLPCYGMAEATLFVSGGPEGSGRLFPDAAPVSCGATPPGVRCLIAGTGSGSVLGEEQEGEILIAGDNVSRRYWNEDPQERDNRYARHLVDGHEVLFLRSGDLGFLRDGQLYVTGRIKDLIIREGRNYHPSDLEAAARKVDVPGKRRNAAAFALSDGAIVLLTECQELEAGQYRELAQRIRSQVLEDCGVLADTIAFVTGQRLPVTTSGKIRRSECRGLFEAGAFAGIFCDTDSTPPLLSASPDEITPDALVQFATQFLSERLGHPIDLSHSQASIIELGLDSLDALAFTMALKTTFGADVPATSILAAPSLRDLLHATPAGTPPSVPVAERYEKTSTGRIPATAEALVIEAEREAGRPAGNVTVAFELPIEVTSGAIQQALRKLTQRHAALRSRFVRGPGGLSREILPAAIEATVIEITPEEQPGAIETAAGTPFRLFAEPPLRALLYRTGAPAQTIQLVMHHSAIDLWSVSILLAEFCRELAGKPAPAAAAEDRLPRTFSPQEHQAALDYWQRALPGEIQRVPVPAPPATDEPLTGRYLHFEFTAEETDGLDRYARNGRASLAAVVLAAYQSALAIFTGESRVMTTVPFHGRDERTWQSVGCFVNPLPVVTEVAGKDSLDSIVSRVKAALLKLLDLQAVPISEVRLRVARDGPRSPLLQFAFAPQTAGAAGSDEIAALAIRGFERPVSIESVPLRPLRVERFAPAADLLLSTARVTGVLTGCLEYDTARISHDFAAGVLESTLGLLRAVAADNSRGRHPDLRVDNEGRGWDSLRVLVGAQPAAHPPCVFDLMNSRRSAWDGECAVEQGDIRWSYPDLFRRAEFAAANLRRRGVRAGDRVAVAAELEPASIALILGLWSIGAAYCPVDPLYPELRRRTILDQLGARLVVHHPAEFIEPCIGQSSSRAGFNAADLPAYAIFTSGSTGRPKGVLVSHRALANTIGAQSIFDIAPGMRVLQACSPGFDASVFEIVLALAFGGTLVLSKSRFARSDNPAAMWELLHPHAAVLPPSLAGAIGTLNPVPHVLILAGEPCPPSLVETWAERCRLFNAYGPTETAIWATIQPLTHRNSAPCIGRPIPGVTVAVVDSEFRPVPAGAPGELVIGGRGLADGYIDEPDLTAERFVRLPLADGARFYRSGDRARVLADGCVDFLGRVDRQIKVNGVRIELGEIESVLQQMKGVKQTAVVDLDTNRGRQLGAYVVLEDPGITESDLRAHIARFLPPAFMPSVIRFGTALPQDAHGKADLGAVRCALSSTEPRREDAVSPARMTTQMVEAVVQACREIFGVGPESPADNLLLLGLHSLNVARFAGRLSQTIHRDVPVALVFERPTLAEFAAAVEALPVIPAEEVLDGEDPATAFPLTPVQRDLWFMSQTRRHADYLIPLAFTIRGPLDQERLGEALRNAVASHPSLRAHIEERDGEPFQSFAAEPESAALEFVDFAGCDGALELVRQEMGERIAAISKAQTYALQAALYRIGPDWHVLSLIGHHLFLDGWSMGVLLDDLGRSYEALTKGMVLPRRSAAILKRYLRERTAVDFSTARLERWREMLNAADPGPGYLADRGAAAEADEPYAATLSLSAARRAELAAMARTANVSLFSLITAAWSLVTARQQGSDAVIVSVVAANRDAESLQNVIGCFATTLPILVETASNTTVEAFWQTVHRKILAAADISGPSISQMGALRELPAVGRSPLLASLVVQSDRAFYSLRLNNSLESAVLPWRFPLPPKADLLLEVEDRLEGLALRLEADPRVFTPRRAGRILAALEHTLVSWLDAGTAQPLTRCDAVSAEERELVVYGFNATQRPYPLDRPLHRLVEDAASRWPNECALSGGGVSGDGLTLTYRQFEERTNQLANALIDRGLKVGTPVGVCAQPGINLVIALHGVMKAGGAYLPLDPANPEERLARAVRDTGLTFAVAESRMELWRSLGIPHLLHPVQGTGASDRPSAGAGPAGPAYILFTSGSTGTPKAAINRHESIANRLLWMQETMPLGPGDRVLQKTSFAFDVSVWEFFWPLLTGATLCTLRPGQNLDAAELYAALQRERISTVHFVPSSLADFLQSRSSFELPHLRRIILSGEELTPALRDAVWRVLDVEIHNLYGPTEAAIDVTHWHCQRNEGPGRVPIGVPVANTQIYVLDRHGRPAPVGAPGELFIGGVQVGDGYAGNPDETRRRFSENPFRPGSRLYRTGDAGRWTEQGCIEFLGRLDDQIKIRGIRVELGEIVASIKRLPGVLEATVLVQGEGSRRRLTGFVILAPGATMDSIAMRSQLAEWLPSAMVPAALIPLERFPLRHSGKIDQVALARLGSGKEEPEYPICEPSSETERAILAAWCDVLDRRRVSVVENFFDVGGNSALLMQLQTRLTRALRRPVPVIDLLTYPTIRRLAAFLDSGPPLHSGDSQHEPAQAVREGRDRLAKLAAMQRNRG